MTLERPVTHPKRKNGTRPALPANAIRAEQLGGRTGYNLKNLGNLYRGGTLSRAEKRAVSFDSRVMF